ncbi:lysis system i-spanin subunit Rz [Paraburkholderia metrosideri]|uniref:Lysis system i-spanin subunit Rz n=1 Tax=Paraburkholderia metrosideri TaxID=580937 RepID=A0ABW9DVR3_9BURK
MNGYFITGIAAGLLGLAIGAGTTHELDANHYGAQLASEKAAHAADIAKVNAEDAQQLATALSKQQAAEGRVATVEQQFNTEVSNHAKDNLAYQSRLASGAERVRVRVTGCVPPTAADKSTTPAGSVDGRAAYADLDPTIATGIVQVTADDQREIDKLKALQAYIAALQQQGFIAAPTSQ